MVVQDLRTTWRQSLRALLAPVVLVFTVRWLFIEPFIVPSGSMIPTLQIHDFIISNKLAYGVHLPFSSHWLLRWSSPRRGEVAVFRYPDNPEIFYVKRIVGLPGDEISVTHGQLFINGSAIEITPAERPKDADARFEYFHEGTHLIRFLDKEVSFFHPVKIPEGKFFAMGDNRDQSSDSRFWGFVPEENLIGSVQWVWLSCEKTLPSTSFLCDPQTIRWNRVLLGVQ